MKHVAVGHGVQNYSCTAAGATSASKGALAVLYDVYGLYPGVGPNSLKTTDQFFALPSNVVYNTALPINLTSTVDRLQSNDMGADPLYPFISPALPLNIKPLPTLDILGHHFFDIDSNPNFVLSDSSIDSQKNASVNAPSTADPGPAGTGAVAWLELTPITNSTLNGISSVYRVSTAGGNGHSCTGAGLDTVVYSALYYFYG